MAIHCVEEFGVDGKLRLCTVEGCEKPFKARGFCGAHWRKWRMYGSPHVGLVMALPSECEVNGCERKPHTRRKGVALCNLHWQRVNKYGLSELPVREPAPWSTCSRPGCDKPSRTRSGALCEMHYGRWYRKETFDDPVYGKAWITSQGYVATAKKGHPLTARNGHLYQHRGVLYDAIGPGEHPCHWCKQHVEWLAKGKRKLVVDHLDGVKTHNARANLVPSCHSCNATRGLFMEWVMKHKDDPFLHDLFDMAKRKAA